MVIGKSAAMYADIFSFYFRNAKFHGLDGPTPRRSPLPATSPPPATAPPPHVPTSQPSASASDLPASASLPVSTLPSRRRTAFVAVGLDFETAEHMGFFQAMANVFGGDPSAYHGRVIGCRIHLNGFLLKQCGNDVRHPFIQFVLALRDTPPAGGMPAVEEGLRGILDRARAAGDKKQEASVTWLLANHVARMAAFPLSSGALERTELLAAGESTNAIESLNRQTQIEVAQHGAPTLIGAIKALMDFDASIMAEVMPTGKAFSVSGLSDRTRMVRSM